MDAQWTTASVVESESWFVEPHAWFGGRIQTTVGAALRSRTEPRWWATYWYGYTAVQKWRCDDWTDAVLQGIAGAGQSDWRRQGSQAEAWSVQATAQEPQSRTETDKPVTANVTVTVTVTAQSQSPSQ